MYWGLCFILFLVIVCLIVLYVWDRKLYDEYCAELFRFVLPKVENESLVYYEAGYHKISANRNFYARGIRRSKQISHDARLKKMWRRLSHFSNSKNFCCDAPSVTLNKDLIERGDYVEMLLNEEEMFRVFDIKSRPTYMIIRVLRKIDDLKHDINILFADRPSGDCCKRFGLPEFNYKIDDWNGVEHLADSVVRVDLGFVRSKVKWANKNGLVKRGG